MAVYGPECIGEIGASEMPNVAFTYLLFRAADLGGYIENPEQDFSRLFRLPFIGGYSIYMARYGATTPTSPTRAIKSEKISVVDVSSDGEVLGSGDFCFSTETSDGEFLGKSVVLGIRNLTDRREGFGKRRYLAMNAVSIREFGQTLYSRELGRFLSKGARERWEKFVREGVAEVYIDPSRRDELRFRFIPGQK
jgi:hypothetical protein